MAPALYYSLFLFSLLLHVYVASTSLTAPLKHIFSEDAKATQTGIPITLRHRDSGKNISKYELLRLAVARSKYRSQRLQSWARSSFGAQAPDFYSEGEYLMTLAIGTPARTYSAIIDTGSDLIWTQCLPCQQCFPQPSPIFDPTKSRTYKPLGCRTRFCKYLYTHECDTERRCIYLYGYGDGSYTEGRLSSETFTFGKPSCGVTLPRITFGCGYYNGGGSFANSSGLVGFGGGPLSLPSQLPVKKFSYCLVTFGSSQHSTLYLGRLAGIKLPLKRKRISFVPNRVNPTFYYLPLVGISVGKERLAISPDEFTLQKNGNGGVILDSGTTLTYLSTDAVSLLNAALASQLPLTPFNGSGPNTGLGPCWYKSSNNFRSPKLVYHFKGGVDWKIPRNNYFVEDSYNGSPLLCSVTQGSPGNPYIIGNINQQNYALFYNLERKTLTFAPKNCRRW